MSSLSIPEYFAGQCILVTGGTGLVGKVLVEKLLRSCPDVERIYLLVRSKKGILPQERWNRITSVALFDKLKKIRPKALEKVVLIDTDISQHDLGLSASDKHMLIANTTIVYHVAASVQFNNNIVDSLKQNTRSTYALLEMAKVMPKLKSFVYVSTTYSNFNRPESEWDEKVYPPGQDWRVLLQMMEREEHTISLLQDKLLGNHPNTYTFSKNLAETISAEYSHLFPVIIFRPSIVTSTTKDPIPGWIDMMGGLSAICTGTALGVVRLFYAKWEDNQDFIPVDKVANGLAVAPWLEGKKNHQPGLSVYNCTVGKDVVCDIRGLTDFLKTEYFYPSKFLLWPTSFTPISNYNLFFLLLFIKQAIPFYFMDRLLVLRGEKPRLMGIVKKMAVGTTLFRSFSCRKISFPKERYSRLGETLEGRDREEFDLTLSIPCMAAELQKNLEGILKYVLHEEINQKAFERNKNRLARMVILDNMLTVIFYVALSWIIMKYFHVHETIQYYLDS